MSKAELRNSSLGIRYSTFGSSVFLHEVRNLVRSHGLDEVVVDQHRRREAARAETLDLDHRPIAVGTRRAEIAGGGVLEKRLHHPLGAAEVARRRRAHLHE